MASTSFEQSGIGSNRDQGFIYEQVCSCYHQSQVFMKKVYNQKQTQLKFRTTESRCSSLEDVVFSASLKGKGSNMR